MLLYSGKLAEEHENFCVRKADPFYALLWCAYVCRRRNSRKSDSIGSGRLRRADCLNGESAKSGLRVLGVGREYHPSLVMKVRSGVDYLTRCKFEYHNCRV